MDPVKSGPPTIYLIAGCNGAGKTTFAKVFLPDEVKCLRFLNADLIAAGLSPFDPAAFGVKAGRILLQEFHECVRNHRTFALESTISGRTYVRLLQQAIKDGYELELHYLWLSRPEQAIARVRDRVRKGGHFVPSKDIRRRFHRSVLNLINDYLPLATRWTIWDSRSLPPKQLASSRDDAIESVATLLKI